MNKHLLPLLSAICLMPIAAHAAVPLSFTHQGLLKEDGNLVNGEREITAIIVDENDAEVARSSGKVPVDSGRYTMTISNIDSDKVAAAQKLKLWVQVEGDLLTPALTINSVPYALAARRAESVNTSGETAAALYCYHKDGGQLTEESLDEVDIERCFCDRDDNAFDCADNFSDREYDVTDCYDKNGAAYFKYKQDDFIRPLEVVAIEDNTIGIGTARPDAPLHILSDVGESDNGYAVHIADPNPKILLEDLDGANVELQGENGTLNVRGGVNVSHVLNAQTIGSDLLNRIYPAGSIYISVSLATEDAVHEALGGIWKKLQDGRVLWSTDEGAGKTIEAGLPNITGSFTTDDWAGVSSDGVFSFSKSDVSAYNGSGGTRGKVSFDASRSSKIYGNSETVQPPAIRVYMYQRIE